MNSDLNFIDNPKIMLLKNSTLVSGRFKSKKTDFGGLITKLRISRYVNPIFKFFMSKNSKNSVVLEYIFIFTKNAIFY